jgi:hypothetical protein
MSDSTELVPVIVPKSTSTAVVSVDDFMPLLTVDQAIARKAMVNQYIEGVMRQDEDFGVIPGTEREGKKPKPVLLKPGAEKLCSIFGLAPKYIEDKIVEDWIGKDYNGETFLFYRVRCQLFRGDRFMGEMSGSCNSWESKYRWRDAKRVCPKCGQQTIIAGKEQYGGGWLCWQKRGGCGSKFADDDQTIVGQQLGRVSNPDVADQANAILKIAQKRALVSAVLVVTNCSDAFTPDLEDFGPIDTGGNPIGTKAASDHVRDKKLREVGAYSPGSEPKEPKVSPSGNGESRDVEHGKRVDSTARAVASPNPPEHPTLAALFASIEDRSKPSNVRLAFELLKSQMIEAMPTNGADEYQRLFTREQLSPQDIPQCKAVMTEMWNVLCFAREQQAKLEPERQFVPADEDVPF